MSETDRVYDALLTRVGEATPRPRIEPVTRLSELLGLPQQSYPVIHVAGTNGKTTTARIIESLLRAYGMKTGLFTSPHLIDFTERIQVDGENITPENLAAAWDEMQPALMIVDAELEAAGHSAITFFEALAVLAYTAFADAPVEVAIVEVGMGGEWDATNIVDAEVSVITPIALEHVAILGDTLGEIAQTKAGIIKAGKTLVSATQPPTVQQILAQRADTIGSSHYTADEHFSLRGDKSGVGGRIVEINGIRGDEYEGMFIPLFGPHQAENATIAVAAVEAFIGGDHPLPDDALEQGFSQVRSSGKLQAIGFQPLVLIDAAHNPAGAKTLARAIEESFDFTELLLIVGTFSDKDSRGVLAELLPLTPNVYVVGINSARSSDPEELAVIARDLRDDLDLQLFDGIEEALNEARGWAQEAEGRGVLITGSVFLAGEALLMARESEWGAHDSINPVAIVHTNEELDEEGFPDFDDDSDDLDAWGHSGVANGGDEQ